MKTCPRCHKTKPFNNYTNNKATKDKLACYCKTCLATYIINYRTKDVSKGREYVISAKARAKKKDIPFDISYDYMMTLWPANGIDCYGRQMNWKCYSGKKGARQDSPSIDRIVPWLGYVKGNVQWLSQMSNNERGACSQRTYIEISEALKR